MDTLGLRLTNSRARSSYDGSRKSTLGQDQGGAWRTCSSARSPKRLQINRSCTAPTATCRAASRKCANACSQTTSMSFRPCSRGIVPKRAATPRHWSMRTAREADRRAVVHQRLVEIAGGIRVASKMSTIPHLSDSCNSTSSILCRSASGLAASVKPPPRGERHGTWDLLCDLGGLSGWCTGCEYDPENSAPGISASEERISAIMAGLVEILDWKSLTTPKEKARRPPRTNSPH
jgi:hypothetical protein